MKPRLFLALFVSILACGCNKKPLSGNVTILLGSTDNMNSMCIGHASGLCGPEGQELRTGVAGIFATEPDCSGLALRALTDKESGAPSNQLPLLLDLYYVGSPRADHYTGTGKDEDKGWMYTFNGPEGHFSATVRTEREAVRAACMAAKGLGGSVDPSVGYYH
jgi:hypothetical protein